MSITMTATEENTAGQDGATERQGLALVPLDLYFRRGKAKVTLALGKGKKLHDKRADAKRKDDEREMALAGRVR